tara:strand:+ start:528 stop:956 length:429 start_codon:yes stop_codon:yes gene_type:complete
MAEFIAPTRDPTASELRWFRENPGVGGYAAPDDRVVVNPFNRLSPSENEALIRNESARIFMRRDYSARPTAESFPLTEAQRGFGYPVSAPPGRPDDMLRRTMAARVLTGDPSAGETTPQQARFADELAARMMMARREAAGGK